MKISKQKLIQALEKMYQEMWEERLVDKKGKEVPYLFALGHKTALKTSRDKAISIVNSMKGEE